MTQKQKKYLKILREFDRAAIRLGVERGEESQDLHSESPLDTLRESTKVLEPLYQSEVKKLRGEVKAVRRQNVRLFSPTTFEIMKRHALEESHSNVLGYLLNQKRGGCQFLKELLTSVGTLEASEIAQLLPSSELKVIREHIVNRKRIDILIDSQKWMIVLENKFYASLHFMEDDSKQTEFYYRHLKERNPRKIIVGILLDKKGREKSNYYTTLDYTQLLSALESARAFFKEDWVYTEYLFLLRRISLHLDEGEMLEDTKETTLTVLREIIWESTKWHLRTT